MQKLLYLLACSGLVLGACNAGAPGKTATAAATSTTVDTANGTPVITFAEMTHNFGNIAQGEKVEYAFKFTNTGNKDLLITDASSTCGCTVPEWPKEPVKPGQTGYMKIIFNSAGKQGYTEKPITIHANTNPPVVEGPKIQCTVVVEKQ